MVLEGSRWRKISRGTSRERGRAERRRWEEWEKVTEKKWKWETGVRTHHTGSTSCLPTQYSNPDRPIHFSPSISNISMIEFAQIYGIQPTNFERTLATFVQMRQQYLGVPFHLIPSHLILSTWFCFNTIDHQPAHSRRFSRVQSTHHLTHNLKGDRTLSWLDMTPCL